MIVADHIMCWGLCFVLPILHTGKGIRRFGGIYAYCRVLHRPEVVDIGVNTT